MTTAGPAQATGDARTPDGAAGRRPARRRSRGLLAGWLALVVVLAGALAVGTLDDGGARSPGDRARDLAESIACPQCDGQSVADSDSDAATAVRSRIEQRIGEGASDAQIRDELADAYGERVLLTPGRSGVSSLVWTLPVVALVAAFAGVVVAFRRWRVAGARRASDDDRALVEQVRARAGTGARHPGDGRGRATSAAATGGNGPGGGPGGS
ncbi:MAG TPA: cytochrome c-type biogenesis protein CcmH [Acidimicrobiales bacterium]